MCFHSYERSDQAYLQGRKAGQWLPRPGEMEGVMGGTAKRNRISFWGNENISQVFFIVVVVVRLCYGLVGSWLPDQGSNL